jgi:hypothetical protein
VRQSFFIAAALFALALNFADGKHTAKQVAEEVSAEYGPVAVDLVLEFLEALKRIGVVE